MRQPAGEPHSDEHLADLLDQCTTALQRGQPLPDGLLDRHPELASLLPFLKDLTRLAPPNSADQTTVLPPEGVPHLAAPGLAVGCVFGDYELLGELGRGGMGVVYKARDLDLDRVVAIKMILSSQFASAEQVRRFHTEARAAARLRHPNIVQVHKAGQVNGQHFFVMEYVEGPTLADVLRRGPLPLPPAVTMLTAVARALAHLHAHGIVHRDIKPANILLQAEATTNHTNDPNQDQANKDRKTEEAGAEEMGADPASSSIRVTRGIRGDTLHPKLTDFGLAKSLGAEQGMTATGAIMGTPSYMAPEQASGRRDLGASCDIYSLGAVLYEVLTGRPPFQGATPLETLVQVLESEATLPTNVRPGVPRELEIICLKCLDKAPEQRYATADALADDLERYQRGEPIEARSHTWAERVRRWVRREPALAVHLGIVGLGATISEVNHRLAPSVSTERHLMVMVALALCALVSLGCQALLRRDRLPTAAQMVWLASDVVWGTVVLLALQAFNGPLGNFYGLMVAASGLWFRVRLVALTTLLSGLGYCALLAEAVRTDADLGRPHYHLIFLVTLLMIGAVVAYQVQRVRVLSQYYDRPLG